jgi:hypothetical protein
VLLDGGQQLAQAAAGVERLCTVPPQGRPKRWASSALAP